MVPKELICYCLKQWWEILQEPKKDLGGHNQLALQDIQERWRAMETVGDGFVQQKWIRVLGAYAVRSTENWRRYVRSACTIGALVVFPVHFVPNVQLNEEAEGEGQSSHHGG
jgi:hypothetical protein